MGGVLENVSSLAVWSALTSWILLGTFMAVQAVVDATRRRRYAVFAAVVLFRAALDFLHPTLSTPAYELLRLGWMGGLTGASLFLLGHPSPSALGIAGGVTGLGIATYSFIHPSVATSVAFPLGFGAIAAAFAARYRERRTFAPAVLCAYYGAMAFGCATYYWTMRDGIDTAMVLGYAHMAALNILAVLFGWSHLPRDLSGRVPVRVSRAIFLAHFLAVLLAEAVLAAFLTVSFHWPPVQYLIALTLMGGATMLLFFHHRHQLAIHTEDVHGLLENRTASLKAAREELALLNRQQSELLEQQARDLEAKSEVIQRQRRLELAAQTAGGYAHDLQNLLAPIFQEIADLHLALERQGAARHSVERVRARLERVLALNSQMLALARRGRMDFHPLSLADLAREVVNLAQTPDVRVQSGTPVWAEGSWSQLSRALGNLIVNALEAQPRRDDTVLIRVESHDIRETRGCHLGFLTPGRWAALSVEDRGPGIPAEIRDRIFEPFFSSKDGRDRSGSGLGLAIVAAVVGDHRGVIDVESGSEGTRMTIYLPEVAVPAGRSGAPPAAQGETILLLDDDPGIRECYGSLLERAGYHVLFGENGRAVKDWLPTVHVDGIILDLQMPGMNGTEACFAALQAQPDIRVVVHSAYGTAAEEEQLRRLGVAAILAKPAGPDEFLRALREALDSRRHPVPDRTLPA